MKAANMLMHGRSCMQLAMAYGEIRLDNVSDKEMPFFKADREKHPGVFRLAPQGVGLDDPGSKAHPF